MKEISVSELKTKLDSDNDINIIDVRANHERVISKIEPSIHIEMNLIPNQMEYLERDKTYYILCRSGARSANVTSFLTQNGFNSVFNIKGGILAWADQIDKTMQKY
jgi:sulfur-carrier protein adenylyltransferase/sulfurtransferase